MNVAAGQRVTTSFYLRGKPVLRNGVYQGEERYPGMGNTDMTLDNPGYSSFGVKGQLNPKILLDDGTVIWGGECWWWPAGNNEPQE